MKEFINKLIGRLEKQAEQYRRRGFEHEQKGYSAMADKYYGKQCSYLHSIEIVNELAEKYQSRVMIDEQFCWQTCVCTDRCNECNRLADGEFDYYESIGEWEEEYINTSTDKSTEQPTWQQKTMNRFERVE